MKKNKAAHSFHGKISGTVIWLSCPENLLKTRIDSHNLELQTVYLGVYPGK
jgi:hypothetical protein